MDGLILRMIPAMLWQNVKIKAAGWCAGERKIKKQQKLGKMC